MKVTSRVNNAKLLQIHKAAIESLKMTGEKVRGNLIESQTMPFDTGDMQNQQTFVENSQANKGKVSIITDAPQARRLYYHPEYNFGTASNKNAGGLWFEPYINGNKKDYAKKVFARFLRSKI
jgi:hypothetical protein